MKIYFRNKVAKLRRHNEGYSCTRCPFYNMSYPCPFFSETILDCYDRGWWVDGELSEIFKI